MGRLANQYTAVGEYGGDQKKFIADTAKVVGCTEAELQSAVDTTLADRAKKSVGVTDLWNIRKAKIGTGVNKMLGYLNFIKNGGILTPEQQTELGISLSETATLMAYGKGVCDFFSVPTIDLTTKVAINPNHDFSQVRAGWGDASKNNRWQYSVRELMVGGSSYFEFIDGVQFPMYDPTIVATLPATEEVVAEVKTEVVAEVETEAVAEVKVETKTDGNLPRSAKGKGGKGKHGK
jgi:hypothetical protein